MQCNVFVPTFRKSLESRSEVIWRPTWSPTQTRFDNKKIQLHWFFPANPPHTDTCWLTRWSLPSPTAPLSFAWLLWRQSSIHFGCINSSWFQLCLYQCVRSCCTPTRLFPPSSCLALVLLFFLLSAELSRAVPGVLAPSLPRRLSVMKQKNSSLMENAFAWLLKWLFLFLKNRWEQIQQNSWPPGSKCWWMEASWFISVWHICLCHIASYKLVLAGQQNWAESVGLMVCVHPSVHVCSVWGGEANKLSVSAASLRPRLLDVFALCVCE